MRLAQVDTRRHSRINDSAVLLVYGRLSSDRIGARVVVGAA